MGHADGHDLEVRDLAHQRRARHGGRGVRSGRSRRASLSVGRCDVSQGARGWPRRQLGDGGRGGREDQRGSPGTRYRRRPVGRSRLLDGVSAEPREARPARRGPRRVGAHLRLKQAIAPILTGATWHGAALKSLPPHGAPAAQTSLREDLADDGVVAARERHQERVFEIVLVSGARAASRAAHMSGV